MLSSVPPGLPCVVKNLLLREARADRRQPRDAVREVESTAQVLRVVCERG